MLYLCPAGRHTYATKDEADRCCSGFGLPDPKELLLRKKALKGDLDEVNERIAEVQKEMASLDDLKRKLEAEFAEIKAKRHEMLSRGELPGLDASLGVLPSDIDSIRSTLAEKSEKLQKFSLEASAIKEQLNGVEYQLSRIEWHAQRNAIYKKMRKTLLEWNELINQILAIRAQAGIEHFNIGEMRQGEYPVFPPGVIAGPHGEEKMWRDRPDYYLKVLGFIPALNFNRAGE